MPGPILLFLIMCEFACVCHVRAGAFRERGVRSSAAGVIAVVAGS